MSTIRRRDLRPRPLSATATALLREIKSGRLSGTPTEIVEASGIRSDWAWSAVVTLQDRRLVAVDGSGRLRPAGGRRRAA